MADNTKIIAANKKFDIGCRVVLWSEPKGLSFSLHGNYERRDNVDFEELTAKLKHLTIHWAASYRAQATFDGLVARKLSCNFIIDDDEVNGYSTIYQCLNIVHGGWSQGELNGSGAGVEIAYMPTAWSNPDTYSKVVQGKWKVKPHEQIRATVHDGKMKVFLPSKAQIASLKALIWGYTELFPHIKPEFPKDENGEFITTVIPEVKSYIGLLNHYNIDRDKFDVAGLDLADIEKDVKARKKFGF
jgi:hypothetical protein